MVLNADETGWKHFNSPECDVEFVENTANSNNEYYGNIEIELSGGGGGGGGGRPDERSTGQYRRQGHRLVQGRDTGGYAHTQTGNRNRKRKRYN